MAKPDPELRSRGGWGGGGGGGGVVVRWRLRV